MSKTAYLNIWLTKNFPVTNHLRRPWTPLASQSGGTRTAPGRHNVRYAKTSSLVKRELDE